MLCRENLIIVFPFTGEKLPFFIDEMITVMTPTYNFLSHSGILLGGFLYSQLACPHFCYDKYKEAFFIKLKHVPLICSSFV